MVRQPWEGAGNGPRRGPRAGGFDPAAAARRNGEAGRRRHRQRALFRLRRPRRIAARGRHAALPELSGAYRLCAAWPGYGMSFSPLLRRDGVAGNDGADLADRRAPGTAALRLLLRHAGPRRRLRHDRRDARLAAAGHGRSTCTEPSTARSRRRSRALSPPPGRARRSRRGSRFAAGRTSSRSCSRSGSSPTASGLSLRRSGRRSSSRCSRSPSRWSSGGSCRARPCRPRGSSSTRSRPPAADDPRAEPGRDAAGADGRRVRPAPRTRLAADLRQAPQQIPAHERPDRGEREAGPPRGRLHDVGEGEGDEDADHRQRRLLEADRGAAARGPASSAAAVTERPFQAIEIAPAATITGRTTATGACVTTAVSNTPAPLASPIQRSGRMRACIASEIRPAEILVHDRAHLEDRKSCRRGPRAQPVNVMEEEDEKRGERDLGEQVEAASRRDDPEAGVSKGPLHVLGFELGAGARRLPDRLRRRPPRSRGRSRP